MENQDVENHQLHAEKTRIVILNQPINGGMDTNNRKQYYQTTLIEIMNASDITSKYGQITTDVIQKLKEECYQVITLNSQ